MTPANYVTLALGAVAPGARLTAAVLGADGQVLMTAGSTLTAAALEKLAERGVLSVAVAAPRNDAELAAARAALHQRLTHLFRRCALNDADDADGAAPTLFRAVLEIRLEALQ